MSTDTFRKSGENHQVLFGGTLLGTAQSTSVDLSLRVLDVRGSGDAGPLEKPLGLQHGSVHAQYVVSDESTFALLGKYEVLVLKDSAGATVFECTCLCRDVQRHEAYRGATSFSLVFNVQGLPLVPDLSHLSFGS